MVEKMAGYDSSKLSSMVEKITAGSTAALGKISMEGFGADNLTTMVEKAYVSTLTLTI